MRKAFVFLAIALCLVAVAWAADMSGTWVLDPAKSDPARGGGGGGARGGGAAEMTIAQTATELTITTMGRGGTPSETKYATDGAEHTVTSQGGDLKYKAVVSGDTLTITGTRTTQRGEMPMKEAYTLSDGGKVLTVARTRTMQGAETTTKTVYNKK